jgi:uncharacterized protein (DUF2147 family)
MQTIMKRVLACVSLVALAIGPASAQGLSPIGKWKLDAGDSQYEVTYCGDGKQLCAKVIYLGPGTLDDHTRPYLNTYLVEGAKPAGANRWKGTVSVYGDKLAGTVEQLGPDLIKLTGCKLIFCKSFKLLRL